MAHIKWNYELVKEYIESYGFKLLSTEYCRTRDKLKMECPKGHIIERRFDHFKNTHTCPKCSGNAKLTYNEVKSYIESQGYKLISDSYKNNSTKLIVECPKHGVFKIRFNDLKNGQRCPKCAMDSRKEKLTYSYDYVKKYVEKEGYELISKEYKNAKVDKLKIKCPKHGIFEMRFGNFTQGQRCPKCGIKHRADMARNDYEYVKGYIESYGYKLLSSKYINNSEKLKIQCNKGHIFYMKFNNFKTGNRCLICEQSSGESEINKFLENNNFNFISQYRFKDCKFKYALPFDFYLPNYNCCIEFDGEQHYEIVKHFGGLNGFIERKIRDTIKTEYCKNNNIKLIRIPYWEINNIETILTKELIKLKTS